MGHAALKIAVIDPSYERPRVEWLKNDLVRE